MFPPKKYTDYKKIFQNAFCNTRTSWTNLTINLNELYEGGVFKSEAELENLIKLNGNINYQIGENTRIAIRAVTRYILGDGTHHDGISRPYGNTAPLLHKNPPKYSSSNISNLMGKIKKGSK